MAYKPGGGKLPGKSEFSGRRRSTTRRSGFSSHPDSTGGEYRIEAAETYDLPRDGKVELTFDIPKTRKNQWIGYGGWFCVDGSIDIEIIGGPRRKTLKQFRYPNWSKFGSMWKSETGNAERVTVTFQALAPSRLAIHKFHSGVIKHRHLQQARPELLGNMYSFSPESHFFDPEPKAAGIRLKKVTSAERSGVIQITLKSCNRCARFLPINVGGKNGNDERNHLSFSNHCVAAHRRPCQHTGFGVLKEVNGEGVLHLEYGFQLECRFCKKFEVNAAHNPKRTTAQMKEDAARRRGFELLLEYLFEGTPQLRYRHKTGRELADDVFENFNGHCFRCDRDLRESRSWHLDHTRPLALLWPLDGSATLLCGTCNSDKRDRPPVEYYNHEELMRLSQRTQLPLRALMDSSPNTIAIDRLMRKLDWFFDEFLRTPEMVKVRDGKVTGELLVKALQKVISQYKSHSYPDLVKMYENRRGTE